MNRLTLELLFLLTLILINGLLAMAEMSLVSARKGRLEQRAARGERGARMALRLLENPTQLLSSVQVGITMIGVMTGVIGGAALADELSVFVAQFRALAPYSDTISIGIVVVAVTYFSLILGELVPKRMALTRPDAFASALARPLYVLAQMASPLVFILTRSTDALLRLARLSLPDEPVLVDEEIRALLREGTDSGSMDMVEKKMVESVLRLDDLPVGAILTPRTEIEWIDLGQTLEEARELVESTAHSVYPAARDELDDIAGFIKARDVLANMLRAEPVALETLVTPCIFVPESMTALRVLEMLKERRQPVVCVVDEYGGLEGMVTLSDILRAIVGDLPDSHQEEEPGIRQRDDGSLLVDGLLSISEFEHSLPWEIGEADFSSDYHTMGGFVMEQLGRVPNEGDKFEWLGMQFEVMDTDGRRVDKILITRENLDSEVKHLTPPEEPVA
jgi:putative hemolysin